MLCIATSFSADHWAYATAMLLAMLAAASPLGRHLARPAARGLQALAAKPLAAIATLVGSSLFLSISISIALGIPSPRLHDEFSNLLAADTFVQGRLTNPPHPLASHFETIHVLQSPTYASKFPPAQGLVMALGTLTTGLPIAGQWFATAGACVVIYWMLLAVLPPPWALLGGLLAAIHPQVLTWSQGYLGSSIALAGGALVLGALLHIITRGPRITYALVLSLGLSILANSRPYEGLLLSVPAAVVFVIWVIRTDSVTRQQTLKRIVLPCTLLMSVTLAGMGYYNWRVTGSPTLSPYVLHEQRFNRTPHFFFLPLKPPITYQFKENAQLHGEWEPAQWFAQRTFKGWAQATSARVGAFFMTWLFPLVLVFPLLTLPRVLRGRPLLWLAVVLVLLFMAGLLPLTWMLRPHYFTPAGGLFFLLLLACLHDLQTRGSWSQAMVRATVAACVVAASLQVSVLYGNELQGWQGRRANVLAALENEPGEHLVIVKYLPEHDVHQEWVYNAAEVDRARVVWARQMTEAEDRELLEYYKGRRAWKLEVGREIRISPYPR